MSTNILREIYDCIGCYLGGYELSGLRKSCNFRLRTLTQRLLLLSSQPRFMSFPYMYVCSLLFC